MEETKKKAPEKESSGSVVTKYKITKPNGNVIYRDALADVEIKAYKAKGCKVEEV